MISPFRGRVRGRPFSPFWRRVTKYVSTRTCTPHSIVCRLDRQNNGVCLSVCSVCFSSLMSVFSLICVFDLVGQLYYYAPASSQSDRTWCALERRAVSSGMPSATWPARRVESKSIRTKKAMVSKRASFGRLPDLQVATSMAEGREGALTLRKRRKRGRMTCVPPALNALQSSQSR